MFVVPTLLDRSGYFLVSFLIVNHRATRTEKTWLNRISATRLCLSLKHVMNKIIWYNVIMTRPFHHSFAWLLVALTDFFCFGFVCSFLFFSFVLFCFVFFFASASKLTCLSRLCGYLVVIDSLFPPSSLYTFFPKHVQYFISPHTTTGESHIEVTGI